MWQLVSWSLQAEPSRFFFSDPRKTSIQLLLEQHTKYAHTTPLDNGVAFLLFFQFIGVILYSIFYRRNFIEKKIENSKWRINSKWPNFVLCLKISTRPAIQATLKFFTFY
jgi:hypothetical protein